MLRSLWASANATSDATLSAHTVHVCFIIDRELFVPSCRVVRHAAAHDVDDDIPLGSDSIRD